MRQFSISFTRQWHPIDLQSPLEPQLATVSDWYSAQAAPSRRGIVRETVNGKLLALAREMADAGIIWLILPVDAAYSRLSALMAFSPVPHDEGEDPFDQLILIAGGDSSAKLFDLETAVGLRTQEDRDVTQQVESGLAAMVSDVPPVDDEVARMATALDVEAGDRVMERRVNYYLGVPQDPDSWVHGAFMFKYDNSPLSTKGADDVAASMDAIMKSFTWKSDADE